MAFENTPEIGSYEVRMRIGRGAQADVYRAYQPSMHREVAIKVLRREFSADDQLTARFRNEVEVSAKLEHAHILPVYDCGVTDDGRAYLVMRLVAGGSLRDRLASGRTLALPEVERVLTQLGAALDYAHAHGVVHRDVKPGNVLIADDENVMLADFGIAKVLQQSPLQTASGFIVGTAAYMSPEQCRGLELTGASDLYSLGILLFEMLFGMRPFEGDNPTTVALKHVTETPVIPEAKLRGLPAGVAAVVLKALEKQPDRRYASGRALAAAFSSAIAGAAAPAVVPVAVGAAAGGVRFTPRLVGVGIGVGVGACLVLLGGWALNAAHARDAEGEAPLHAEAPAGKPASRPKTPPPIPEGVNVDVLINAGKGRTPIIITPGAKR